MCVSVTVMVATLVLLQGVGGGSSLQIDDGERLANTEDRCLQKCWGKSRPRNEPNTPSSPGSRPCCDFFTLKCVINCNMRQKGIYFPKSTSVEEDFDVDTTATASLDYSDHRTDIAMQAAVVSAWMDAMNVCKCRRKRLSRSPLVREREAALIARSVGLDLATTLESRGRSVKVKNVRVVSQSHGEDTVSVEVAWEPVSSSASRPVYLVSWQAQGDALRGTLLTNTPSTTLSLLPDAVYSLQISAAGADSPSASLVVDTHPPPPAQLTHTLSLTEDSAGAAAALSALLVLVLLLAVRWCNTRRTLGVKDNADPRDSDHFKVFPPPVTLLVDPPLPLESPSQPHPQPLRQPHHLV